MRILIVDDEARMAESIKDYFQPEGLESDLASNGGQARRLLEEKPYDALVSDLRMPGMDGMQLLRWVKDEGPEIPVIMISAHGDIRDAVEAMREGAYDYLVKPFDPDELLLKVRKAVEERDKEKRLRMERKRLERLLNLYKMSDAPEERVFRYALESALDMCEARFGFLGRMIEGGDWISLLCTIGAGTPMEDDAKAKEVEMASGPWMEAVRRREPVVLNDASAVQDITAHCRQSGSVRNMLMVPLLDGDEVVMVLGIGNCPAGFDDSDAQQVSLLLNGAWEIVMRRSSEEKLVQSRKELESHQDRLQQVEIRFHTLFERAQDGVILMGDRFIESNSRWGEMLGYSPEELVGKRPWEVSPAKQPNGTPAKADPAANTSG